MRFLAGEENLAAAGGGHPVEIPLGAGGDQQVPDLIKGERPNVAVFGIEEDFLLPLGRYLVDLSPRGSGGVEIALGIHGEAVYFQLVGVEQDGGTSLGIDLVDFCFFAT